jgi:hypothetical protein
MLPLRPMKSKASLQGNGAESDRQNRALFLRFSLATGGRRPFSGTRMQAPEQSALLSIIQLSITPVILISGLGGLMISLTNRMARIVDRTRALSTLIRNAPPEEKDHLVNQITVMWHRANLMRWSVTCAAASMLVGCLLIGGIFLGAMLHRELAVLMIGFFGLSLAFLIACLILFLRDLFISLVAIDIEVKRSTGLKN